MNFKLFYLTVFFIISVFLNACHDYEHRTNLENTHLTETSSHLVDSITVDPSIPAEVIDVSDAIDEGTPTIVVTFNKPIDKKKKYQKNISLLNEDYKEFDGAWVLADNGLEIKYHFLDPDSNYTVVVNKGMTFIDGSKLPETFKKEIKTYKRQPSVGFFSNGFILPKQDHLNLPVLAF
ncbi:MAG: hypothetical protein N4Q30_06040, partial [Neisseriaceae bacterium]|nr:hypothetical protein [Neisseriaceae bacterium]